MESNELKDLLEKSNAEIQTQFAKANEEVKTLGTVTNETKAAFDNLKAQVESLRAEVLRPHSNGGSQARKSLGQIFIEAPEIKEWCKGWHKSSRGIEVDSEQLQAEMNAALVTLGQKTTITSGAVGAVTPGILQFEHLPGVFIPPVRRLRVRDLIPFRPTTMSGVDFVRRDTFTNAASPVAETVSKEESAITYTIDSANVRTIAHWVPAARQVLEDMPALQAAIDYDLLQGLLDIEDYELLRGSGAGQHLKGIITAATTAYAGTYTVASDTMIDTANHSIAELEDSNYVPDGMVIHPSDWRKMQVIKESIAASNTGAYILGGPAASPRKVLWDLPIVATTAMVKGKFLTGQFSGSVQGFDRTKAVIDISTEHSDFFVRNMVAVRAEERIAVAVTKPAAFRYGSF